MVDRIVRDLQRSTSIRIHDENLLEPSDLGLVDNFHAVGGKKRLALVHMRELVCERQDTLLRNARLASNHAGEDQFSKSASQRATLSPHFRLFLWELRSSYESTCPFVRTIVPDFFRRRRIEISGKAYRTGAVAASAQPDIASIRTAAPSPLHW